MGGDGFEPSKQVAADLQSVPFGHSGIHPYYFLKIKSRRSESNQRHKDFQSSALPTELPGQFLGPSAQCRRPGSNRYEYHYSRDFKSRASASSATPARRGENGRRWIRTTEAFRSRFTVCPLWPLGNPPVLPRRALKISQHLEKCKQFFSVILHARQALSEGPC